MTSAKRKIPVIRILLIASLAFASGLLLLMILLLSLPTLLSSHMVQVRIQKVISSSIKRQVGWSNLQMTWSKGLTLSGFILGDGPPPLLKTEIEQIIVVPSADRGADGRRCINLAVRIQKVQVELASGPSKQQPPSSKDPLTLLAEKIELIQGMDFLLPVDVNVMIDVAPLQVVYRAPSPAKQLKLQDFSLRFAMPSLSAKPIKAEVTGKVLLNDRSMGNIRIGAKVTDLVTKEQRIHLASALFSVEVSAPGTSLMLSGGLSQPDGVVARCKLNLAEILEVSRPLLPAKLPNMAGNIEILLRAKADAKRDLNATLTLDSAGLTASGGPLQKKQFGPIDMRLQQQVATDHQRQRVEFSGGKLTVPRLLDVAWSGLVKRPSASDRSMELSLGPLKIDIASALTMAAPFLPPDAPYKDIAGETFIRSLDFKLNGPANNGELTIAGLGIKLPHFRIKQKKGELTADEVEMVLEKVECPLVAKHPIRLTADLFWSLRRASLSGSQPFSAQGLRGKLGVVVSDVNFKSASPYKVAASAVLTQSVDFDMAKIGTQFTLDKVHEQLRIVARLSETGDVELSLPESTMTAASIEGNASGKRFGQIPFSTSLTATGLRLPSEKGARPTLQHAAAIISAGDVLQCAADAALTGSSVSSNGNLLLNLGLAMPVAATFVPPGFKADGVVQGQWRMVSPLSESIPASDKRPLHNFKARLSQFDTLDLAVKLDTLSVTVPTAKGVVKVTGLRTKPDVRIISIKKGESVKFEGGILFSGLNGLPGAAGKFPTQHGSFAYNGELSGWKELRLNEELRIHPMAVMHDAELNVSRIDTLMEEKKPFNAATLIKRLDATLFATVDGAFSSQLKQFLPGIDLTGDVNSSARVDLTAGRELALRYSLNTKEFGVKLANGTKVEGVRSAITINRVYDLAAAQGERWTPLSTALIKPTSASGANPGAVEVVGRIHDDLRGVVGGARSFSVRSVTVNTSAVPLVISALEGDLLFTQEKCGISFFQADMLGGTLLARSLFDLRPDVPVIAAGSSFSNIDITHLLPKETRKTQGNKDSEITGEMTLTTPLTAEQRELFEQLRLLLNVRKIGANAIERALFSLDPYERNEQVVAQRKMLHLGTLKGLRANAVDGAFSMEGEALIKGVAVDLPKVERLRISELPLRQELVKNREGITALRGFLELVRADTLVVGPKGELSLKRRNYEK